METRRFGRTGHFSTVAILGGAAFGKIDQATADAAMPRVLAAGVNHIDIAPSYGNAEERLAPWIARERQRFFLGCKTTERSREGAAAELHRSLERLRADKFDLYQMHAVKTMEELDAVTAHGGALKAAIAAREQGLTRFIGITGHGLQAPTVFLEALRRFDFDTVLFPINARLFANADYRREATALLHECRARDVGVMAIKSVCKSPWGNRSHTYTTWYEPFDDSERIQAAINFALSQDITAICTLADLRVLSKVLDACARFTPMDAAEQAALIAGASEYEPLFA